jgi:hypothetical protein
MNKTTTLKDVIWYGFVGINVSDGHAVYTFYLDDGSGRFLSQNHCYTSTRMHVTPKNAVVLVKASVKPSNLIIKREAQH